MTEQNEGCDENYTIQNEMNYFSLMRLKMLKLELANDSVVDVQNICRARKN